MSKEPLDACVSCGALVPERQTTPYPGHHDGCALRGEWLARELRRSVEPPPAAGPWVRVDSGERPGDGEEVLIARSPNWHRATYYDDGDVCYGDDCEQLTAWTHWARVYLPGEET